MTEHPVGRPVNPSTYTNHRCRCDGCSAAWAEHARTARWQRVYRRAHSRSAVWVRENRPDVWSELLAEANEHIGGAS